MTLNPISSRNPEAGLRVLMPMLIVLLGACTPRPLYEHMDTLKDHVWSSDEVFEHRVEVQDTLQSYDLYLNLRIGAGYEFSNMYLFIGTEFPDGRKVRDTVECILADRTGRWLGKGLGDIRDNRIMFKPRIRFPRQGTYAFRIEQGMRTEQLEQVYDVGISLTPSRSK